MVIGLTGVLGALVALHGDADDKSNTVERGAKRTGKRAADATERMVDKTQNRVRKKTK